MATTLDELVVKIQADVSGLRQDFAEAQKVTQDTADKIEKALGDMSDHGGKHLLNLSHIAETAFGVFGGEALVGMVEHAKEAVVDLFKEMLVEGVKGAEASQDAITRLNFALAQAGQYSKSTSTDIQELAETLQGETKYSKDAVLQTSAFIESLGRLDKEGLARATRTALDLSAALGIDLQTATTLVGKAAAGEIGTFGRYGVKLTEGATKAETFAMAMDELNRRFGGAAAAQVDTFSGSTAQLHNQWEELTKELGNTIVNNQAVIGVMHELADVLEEAADWIKENNKEIRIWIAEA